MNLGQLRDRVRLHLAEQSTQVLSDNLIDVDLNLSQRRLASELGLFPKEAVLTIPAGGWLAALPFDYMAFGPGDVYEVNSTWRLSYAQPQSVRNWDSFAYTVDSRAGRPHTYYVTETDNVGGATGPSILVHPAPTSDYDVRVSYYATPGPMTGDSALPWNGFYSDYHDLIALHSAARLGSQLGMQSAAAPVWDQRLAAGLEEFRNVLGRKRNHRPLKLISTLQRRGWRGRY